MIDRPGTAPERRLAAPAVFGVLLATIVLAGLALRIGLIGRSGLWADEFFSLAIATGHSLEHPAAAADASLGDFVEARGALPPSGYARYLEHETPAAGPGRVVRAVLLSDTSPPLYYLTLYAWTRAFGTGDAALRLLSVAFWLACLPPLCSLARRVSGRNAVLPACLLFCASPLCLHYATEGRMYSMLWFLVMTTASLTLGLHRRRRSALLMWSSWVFASSCGMLTHYFFVFPWAGCVAWLFIHPGRSRRSILVAAVCIMGLAIGPWYANVPRSLGAWRVTGDWLKIGPDSYNPAQSFLRLFWNYFSPDAGSASKFLMCAVLASLICLVAWRDSLRWFSTRRQLLWFWLLASTTGPFVFDLLRGTFTVTYPRYSISGMPAAYLLAAVALNRLGDHARVIYGVLFVAAWSFGIRNEWRQDSRALSPYRQAAAVLSKDTDLTDVVIIHSIPSGVVGLSRYMEPYFTGTKGPDVAAWVGQLGRRRVPQDIESLAEGRRRVRFVNIHAVGEPSHEDDWLRRNGTIVRDLQIQACHLIDFIPRDSETFGGSPRASPPVPR